MSDIQRPPILTLLAILALVTGAFSLIRGGLLIFGGVSQVADGFGGVPGIIIGALSLAVGVLAVVSGAKVLMNKKGGVSLMWKYAIALIGYTLVWIVYSLAGGGKVSWMSIFMELAIGAVTLWFVRSNEEIQAYLEAER